MTDPKPFASLSPSLLARKGAARPAMRPQVVPLRQFNDSTARQIDDLGWNDMGFDHGHDASEPSFSPPPAPVQAPAEIVSLTPHEPEIHERAEVPAVVRQQDEITERVAAVLATAPAPAPVLRTAKAKRTSALAAGRRAAFTLRLDAERHLRLRLACAVGGRSAQHLVIEALDRLLADMPEVDSLAAQVSKQP